MQYILSEEEYNALKGKPMNLTMGIMSESEITAYMRRLPNFGPVTILTMLQYFKEDGIVMGKAIKEH